LFVTEVQVEEEAEAEEAVTGRFEEEEKES